MRGDECFDLIWNASDHLPPLQFLLIPLVFIGIGLTLLFGGKLSFVREMFKDSNDGARMAFGAVFATFATFFLVASGQQMMREWWALRNATPMVVAGQVENFHAMPSSGHDTERFTVDGVPFSYSNYIVTSGFNNTRSHGGPNLESKSVRIEYISHNGGNVIAKLSVACSRHAKPRT